MTEVNEFERDKQLGITPTAAVGSLLFISIKPVSVEALAKAAKLRPARVEDILESLKQEFSDDTHGFSLQEVAGGWQFRTAPAAAQLVRQLVPRRGRRLSRAGAETLAVVAYQQPVGRAEIESVRGVDALPTLKTLLDARLVRIVGRQDSPGQPALYGTTKTFLEKFGLNDLTELPSVREIEQLMAEPGEHEANFTLTEGDSDVASDDNFDEDSRLEQAG